MFGGTAHEVRDHRRLGGGRAGARRGRVRRGARAAGRGNRVYEERFGYIFIVCATGKRADEMLALLESRLPNAPARELEVAAAEQMKITHLRLDKLLEDS